MSSPEEIAAFIKSLDMQGHIALSKTLNAFAVKVKQEAIDAIHGRYNLEKSYISQRMEIRTRANPKKLEATISARVRATQLIRFGAKQETRAGIKVAQRSGGISVQVLRENPRKNITYAFAMKLKRGSFTSGNFGMVARTGEIRKPVQRYRIRNGKKVKNGQEYHEFKTLYGPSVHGAFAWFREELEPSHEEIFDDFISRLNL
ncbi:hypothetical protein [Rheinheimera sp. MMS21-TC3]|uniref:hypothetical protein n=1 Tax=Rheinheimera sp. MMS21-TC3 TaxID=3072790 RepID=UPI0028C3BB0C|nr:hypothetical protein [Rheinheimera sp. MMS21-TC3]WNO60887.1 hypothetical protein RDV63_07960 [Rheinheimera sp. MMS21-TC3]